MRHILQSYSSTSLYAWPIQFVIRGAPNSFKINCDVVLELYSEKMQQHVKLLLIQLPTAGLSVFPQTLQMRRKAMALEELQQRWQQGSPPRCWQGCSGQSRHAKFSSSPFGFLWGWRGWSTGRRARPAAPLTPRAADQSSSAPSPTGLPAHSSVPLRPP